MYLLRQKTFEITITHVNALNQLGKEIKKFRTTGTCNAKTAFRTFACEMEDRNEFEAMSVHQEFIH